MAMMEQESISRLDYGGRSGGSGGVVYSTTNSHSLSAVTKKNNSILNSHVKGVGLSCTYLNDKGEVKSYKSIYNDILMQRIDNDDKLDRLLSDKILRDMTLKEMSSRLQAYIIACHLCLVDDKITKTFAKLHDI